MTDDNIFAVTGQEGGLWLPLSKCHSRIHSVIFDNGQTWDEINGFRGPLMDYTKKSMAIVQSNWDALFDLEYPSEPT